MGFAIGENVGPYRITAQLGSGGMATVYKAYHAALDRYVAVKVMHAAFREDRSFLARFQREARIVARLEHPHIVPVFDFSEHDGQPYLVMRFIEGDTLKARLQAGQLTIPEVMTILRPVCQALAYAHEQGVLHRDIKPSNILLTPQGGVYLTDFGLARIAQAGESTLSQDQMLGTPQYISPEQAQGNPNLDVRTDIYSLGVVMYELLVGRVPFQADTPYATIHDHIYSPLPMPRCLKPDLPVPFERVLLKSLAKERDDRYTTVSDLFAALDKAAAEAVALPADVVEPPPCEETVPLAAPAAPTAAQAAGPFRAVAPTPATTVEAAPTVVAAKQPTKSHRNLWIALGVGAVLLICAILVIAGLGRSRQLLQKARQLRNQGLVEQSLAAYEAAIRADPKQVEAYLEPAEMLMKRGQPGDYLQASGLCMRGLQAKSEDEGLHACAARAWWASGDLDKAVPHLDWLIQHKPTGGLAHAGMAIVMLQQGKLDQAQNEAQRAVQLDPNAPEGHFALGLVLMRTGQPQLARDQFRFVLNSPVALRWMKDQAQR